MFCLFDGHGGDSVAEFCRNHLADRIVQRFWELHAARPGAVSELMSSNDGPEGKNSSHRSSSSKRRSSDEGSGRVSTAKGGGGWGGTTAAAAEPSLVADCVREACREVDAQVNEISAVKE